MKNLFSLLFVITLSMFITACSSNSPRNTAEKALDCLINEDYRGYFDYVYFPDKDKEKKESFIQMVEEKSKKSQKDGNKIVGYKFKREQINKEAGKAKVTFDITYNDGTVKETVNDMILAEDGKWYLSMKK